VEFSTFKPGVLTKNKLLGQNLLGATLSIPYLLKGIVGASTNVLEKNKPFLKPKYLL
jgi:hypothetical protein